MNGENWSYDVKFWNTDIRQNRPTPYRVRWVVAGQVFSDSFATSGLADGFRSQLVTLARNGEPFGTEEGLPRSLLRKHRDVSFLVHAREYAAFSWKDAAGKSRLSILETLSRVVPVVTCNVPGALGAAQVPSRLTARASRTSQTSASFSNAPSTARHATAAPPLRCRRQRAGRSRLSAGK